MEKDKLHQAREQIKAIAGEKFQLFRTISLLRRVGDILLAVTLWTLGALLVAHGQIIFTVLGVMLMAMGLNICLLLLHEGMHHTLFRSDIANYIVTFCFGILFGTSFYSYRLLHRLHHKELGTVGDPDNYERFSNNRYALWSMYYIRLLTGAFMYIFLFPFFAWRSATTRGRVAVFMEYTVLICIYIVIAKHVPLSIVIWYWFIPVMIVAYFTALRGFAEHIFTLPSDPFTASRTIKGSPVTNFLMLNINYHLAHHLFPEVPSYNLGKVHKILQTSHSQQIIAKSYPSFLWDFIKKTRTMNNSPMDIVKIDGIE